MSTHSDVIVVGGGPAGASAASALARRGISVLLVEKAVLPRYKTCGGGLAARAWGLLPCRADGVVERECRKAELNFFDAGLSFRTERQEPVISMVMRDRLDALLVLEAEASGARILQGCKVEGVVEDTTGVSVRTPSGIFRARFLIGADGVFSRVAASAGWRRPVLSNPAVECELPVPDHILERYDGLARFDFGIVRAGYGWIFPKEAHLSVGVMRLRQGWPGLRALLEDYLRLLGLPSPSGLPIHGFAIPSSPRDGGSCRGRILLVGDAAGLADPVTGEGITHALGSGKLAAQSILESGMEPLLLRELYSGGLEKEILGELRLGRILARILYGMPKVRTFLFTNYGQKLCEAVTDVLTGKSTYRQKLSDPANYLKLLHGWRRGIPRSPAS